MTMHAVFANGGHQYRVAEKDIVTLERITGEEGSAVIFDQVLAIGEGADMKIGTPTVEGAKVEAKIVAHFRGPKLVAFKMKRRKGYRKKIGHRQELTKVEITKIG